WLADIQQAIANKTILNIAYTDSQNKKSTREIEPVGLIFYTNQWHLYAWCCGKKDYRDFIISRISKLVDTYKTQSIKQHRNIADYMRIF
ncbi:MAG: helix-turn-helix transcriptional regulator, partial [Bacteroidia bacterium]